jgi:hypothetical protein
MCQVHIHKNWALCLPSEYMHPTEWFILWWWSKLLWLLVIFVKYHISVYLWSNCDIELFHTSHCSSFFILFFIFNTVFHFSCVQLFFMLLSAASNMGGRPIQGPHFVEVDLGRLCYIEKVLIDWEDGYSDSWTLEVYLNS